MLVAALLASGCSTKQMDEMSYTELREYAATMLEKCKEQGVPEAELEACARQEARADQSRRMRQRAIGEAISEAGDSYSRSAAANRPVSCTSTRAGSMINTTCY